MKTLYNSVRQWIENMEGTATKLGLKNMRLGDRLKLDAKLRPSQAIATDPVLGESKIKKEIIRKKCKDYEKMPIHFLPSVSYYKAQPTEYDWLTLLLLKEKVREGEAKAMALGGLNNRANGHVKYRMNLMGHMRDEGKYREYWRLGKQLLKCKAFQVMAFNRICSNHQSELTLKETVEILKEVDKLIEKEAETIDYKRVYIPKSNGKVRPLGVPTKPWRIYLHMWNVLLVWFRMKELGEQHGYIPGRGVHTAWESIIKEIKIRPNIYEFDLKGYFNEVRLSYMEKLLKEIGVPEEIAKYQRKLNQSIIKLTEEDLVDESANRMVILNNNEEININIDPEVRKRIEKLVEEARKLAKESSTVEETIGINVLADKSTELKEYIQELQEQGYTVFKEVGVAQGSPTSCGLSTLNVNKITLGGEAVMYADDGVIFPKDCKTDPEITDVEAGVIESKEKSGWVRKNWVWQKPLKFCGLMYIPEGMDEFGNPSPEEIEPRIKSCTRSGTKRLLKNVEQFQLLLQERRKELEELIKKEEKLRTTGEIDDKELYEWLVVLTDDERENRKEPINKTEEQLRKIDELNVVEWIRTEYENFLVDGDKLSRIFRGKGLRNLAQLFSKEEVEERTPSMEYKKGSWVWERWGGHLYEMMNKKWMIYLLSYQQILVMKLENMQIKLKLERDNREEVKVGEMLKQLEELITQLNEFGGENPEEYNNSLNECFVWEEGKKPPRNQESNEAIEKQIVPLWRKVMGLMKIDMYNASSHACHDILKAYESEEGIDSILQMSIVKKSKYFSSTLRLKVRRHNTEIKENNSSKTPEKIEEKVFKKKRGRPFKKRNGRKG